ncbi:hypothetical protein [Cellulomonas aerilata]|nr:hypothetical protein [Cellulomonas aerilata]
MSHDARRSFRSRATAALRSEALVWAVVLGCVSALAAVSGAVGD